MQVVGVLSESLPAFPPLPPQKTTPHIGSTLAWLMPGYLLYLGKVSVGQLHTYMYPPRTGRFKSLFVHLCGVDGLELRKPVTDRLTLYSRGYLFFVLRFALLSHSWYRKNMSHISGYPLNIFWILPCHIAAGESIHNHEHTTWHFFFLPRDKHRKTSQHLIHWRKWGPLFRFWR